MDRIIGLWHFLNQQLSQPVMVIGNDEVTAWTALVLTALFAMLFYSLRRFHSWLWKVILQRISLSQSIANKISLSINGLLFFFGSVFILDVSEVDITGRQILEKVYGVITAPIIPVGDAPITISMLLYIFAFGALLVFFSRRFKHWLADKILSSRHIDIGTRQAVATIVHYVLLAVGFVVILQAAGIDLSTLTVIAGGLGLGLGFGLQNIASNLISGLIVMIERPVKVGDRIEVDGITGDIVKISMRAATLLTNDNIEIIIPNSNFIEAKVINWSHSDRHVRFGVPVGVSYDSDPDVVSKALLNAANEHKGVLSNPAPSVFFDEFGDSSLNFELRVSSSAFLNKPRELKSQLNRLIFKELKKAGVEIPFPQRDLHIRNSTPVRNSYSSHSLETPDIFPDSADTTNSVSSTSNKSCINTAE